MNINPSDTPLRPDLEYYPGPGRKQVAMRETLARNGTPIFLCDPDILTARYLALDECLTDSWQRHILGYSFKTTCQVASPGILRQTGAWV